MYIHMSKYHRITKMYVHYCHIHIGMGGITNLYILTQYGMSLILNNCGIVSPIHYNETICTKTVTI